MPASMSIQVLVQHTFPLFGYRKLLGLGVCYGVTMLANDAILRGRPGIHEFVRRFQLLAQYNADNTALMRAIESTRGKRELGEQLSLDERLLLEMPAFIEKIHFLQDEENRLVKQESRRRLSSDTDMQHAEGTTELAAIAGIYAPGELEQSFTQLRAYDHLQPHSLLHAINLNFYNMEHIVAVAYDAALGKYLLFNADDPVSEFTALTAYDAASCAKKIHLAFTEEHNPFVGLVSKVYGLARDSARLRSMVINPWRRIPVMLAIHQTLTQEKIEWTQQNGSWLHLAAIAGDDKTVNDLLKAGINPNIIYQNVGITALHIAVLYNHPRVIAALLASQQTDRNLLTYADHYSAIYLAARYDRETILKILLDAPESIPSIADCEGLTPLHIAAKEGRKQAVQILLEKINPNALTKQGSTPLHLATQQGHIEIINILLNDLRVDVNAANAEGDSAFHIATKTGQVEVTDILLHMERVHVNAFNEDGDTGFHLAAKLGHIRVMRVLLRLHSRVASNLLTRDGYTALHLAAKAGQATAMQLLLDHQYHPFNINALSRDGQAAIHVAAEAGQVTAVQVLLEHLAIVNSLSGAGYTALQLAVLRGCLDVTKLLLSSPAVHINVVDKDGCSPLYIATDRGDIEIMRMLLSQKNIDANLRDHVAENTALHIAVKNENVESLKSLLQLSTIDPNIPNKAGNTALHLAAKSSLTTLIQPLLMHPKINKEVLDIQGRSALQIAEAEGYVRAASLLRALPLPKGDAPTVLACGTPGITRSVIANGCRLISEEPNKLAEERMLRHYEIVKKWSEKINVEEGVSLVGAEEAHQIEQLKQKHLRSTGGWNRAAHTVNQAYMAYQIAKGIASGDPAALAWTVVGIGCSVAGNAVTKQLRRVGTESNFRGLRTLGRPELAVPIGQVITALPIIVSFLQDLHRFQVGEADGAAENLMVDAEVLTISLTETGLEIIGAESSPVGTLLTTLLLISLDIGKAVEMVEKLKEVIHLSRTEILREGLRAFFELSVSTKIADAEERALQIWNRLEDNISRFFQHPRDRVKIPYINTLVLSLGSTIVTEQQIYTGENEEITEYMWVAHILRCETKTVKKTVWGASDDSVYLTHLPSATRDEYLKASSYASNLVILNWATFFCFPRSEWEVQTHVMELRTTPAYNPIQNINCKRQIGEIHKSTQYTQSPRQLVVDDTAAWLNRSVAHSTHCHNAVIMQRSQELYQLPPKDWERYVLVDLGAGNDRYITNVDQPHIIFLKAGRVSIQGSQTKNDTVIFDDCVTTGTVDLFGGYNVADFSHYCSENEKIEFMGSPNQRGGLVVRPAGRSQLEHLNLQGARQVLGRIDKKDIYRAGKDIEIFNGQGGNDEITIDHQERIGTVLLYAGDQLILRGEPNATHVILSLPTVFPTNASIPITINMQNMTGLSGMGTHLITGGISGTSLTEITDLIFKVSEKKLTLRIQGQLVQLFYPPGKGNNGLLPAAVLAFATQEGYLLSPVVVDHPTVDVVAVTAALLYVMPRPLETFVSIVARMRNISAPMLSFSKHASLSAGEIIMGGEHPQVFDIISPTHAKNTATPYPSIHTTRKKYFFAGSAASTFVIRKSDRVELDLLVSPVETTVDMIDLSHMPDGARHISLSAVENSLKLTVEIGNFSSRMSSTATVEIKSYNRLYRKLLLLKEKHGQHYELVGSLANPRIVFSDEAKVLFLNNTQGMVALDAKQLTNFRYSALAIPYLAPQDTRCYRHGDALFIAGKNHYGLPLSLFMPNFYTENWGARCGSELCRFGLFFGGAEKMPRVHWPWEHLQTLLASPATYIDFLRSVHGSYIHTYIIDFTYPFVLIELKPDAYTILDLSASHSQIGRFEVKRIDVGRLTLSMARSSTKSYGQNAVPDRQLPKPTAWQTVRIVITGVPTNSTDAMLGCGVLINSQYIDLLALQAELNGVKRVNDELKTKLRVAHRKVEQTPTLSSQSPVTRKAMSTVLRRRPTTTAVPSFAVTRKAGRVTFKRRSTLLPPDETTVSSSAQRGKREVYQFELDRVDHIADNYLKQHDHAKNKTAHPSKKAVQLSKPQLSQETQHKRNMTNEKRQSTSSMSVNDHRNRTVGFFNQRSMQQEKQQEKLSVSSELRWRTNTTQSSWHPPQRPHLCSELWKAESMRTTPRIMTTQRIQGSTEQSTSRVTAQGDTQGLLLLCHLFFKKPLNKSHNRTFGADDVVRHEKTAQRIESRMQEKYFGKPASPRIGV